MPSATPTAATDYEVVIGLEVHAQLLTASKMFCRCSADYANAAPNTHCCPICMGFPGTLPVINERAVEYTVMTALALHCEIPEFSKFDRKNYFYPDLPKGYQISQYDIPLSRNGYLTIQLDGQEKRIGITRVHLEEDTGRHLSRSEHGEAYSLVDLNRAGVPLMEIVSEPDIRSAEEARLYVEKLRSILVYLGVNSGRMEEGALRCDANISLRPRGQEEFGVKTEIKNMNSFRAVERALIYEAARQLEELRAGRTIVQQTRGWREDKGVTVLQRVKEFADDYRYFPEPDLPPLTLQPRARRGDSRAHAGATRRQTRTLRRAVWPLRLRRRATHRRARGSRLLRVCRHDGRRAQGERARRARQGRGELDQRRATAVAQRRRAGDRREPRYPGWAGGVA